MTSSTRGENTIRSLRILIAEDNTINQLFLTRLLTRGGHKVEAVSSGAQVLEALGNSRPEEAYDVVLMDIQMPGMDGIEATQRIRRQDPVSDVSCAWNPSIPVVALTAHGLTGDRELFLEAGMDAYLAKPVDKNDLFRLFEDLGLIDAPQEPETREPATSSLTLDSAKTLDRLRGDRDFLSLLYQTFLSDLDSRISSMRNALDQVDLPALAKLAHSLKGAAGTIDATNVHQQALKTEKAAKSEELESCRALFSHLVVLLGQLREASTAFLEKTR